MRKIYKKGILLMVTMLLLSSIMGCSLQSAFKEEKVLDKGTVEGNVYQNEFFGMSVTVPEEWQIASEEEIEELTKAGNEVIAGDDEAKKKMMELSNLRTVYLLSTTSNDTKSPASLMMMAEKLSFYQNVEDGKGYLEAVQENLGKLLTEIPYEFNKEIYSTEIGGKEFYVLEATVDAGYFTMTQTYYATVMNKYALAFVTTTIDEESAKTIEEMIGKMEFK